MMVTRNQKIYFFAVGLLALWVGVWGFFIPEQVDKAIPWLVPPLHARFIGAIYLAAVVIMGGSMMAHKYDEVHVATIMVSIWTGSLFIISLFYLAEFDFSRGQVWFWFGAYIAYPIIGIWYAWTHWNTRNESAGVDLPAWIRTVLLVEGAALSALSLALLFAPNFMLTLWPWKVTRLLIQIYSGPFLSFGVGSLLLSRQRTWSTIRIVVTGVFVLALGALIASTIHRSLFSFASPAAWIWFGGFSLVLVSHGSMILLHRTTGSK
ncbi:MAG TPA: hypothetical protein VJ022_08825 [Anaerolineales bacterium]|nr:hypothetical protein [Anaerolineales bacterium]